MHMIGLALGANLVGMLSLDNDAIFSLIHDVLCFIFNKVWLLLLLKKNIYTTNFHSS